MGKIILYLYFILFAISCKQNKLSNLGNPNINLKDSEIEKKFNLKISEKGDSLQILIENLDKIKILNIKKGYMETSLPDSLACETWLIKKNDLIDIIRKTKQIDSSDLHYLFETQTCIYRGNFELNGMVYSYGINSGGWLHIQFGDIVLGCFDKGCENYFMGKVDKPEKEFE